jgi:predicted phage terminase large subunit-like protein
VSTLPTTELTLEEIDAAIERRRNGKRLAEEADDLAHDLRQFVKASWHTIVPNVPYVHGWHIDTICDHLEAVTAGDIRRLQVWIPPGTSKSTTVSIAWPVWEWLQRPELRYLTASYDLDLATRFAVRSRDLIRSAWFRARFPQVELKRDEDLKRSYANTEGGMRVATSPSGGATGQHADRILIDDPLNARDVVSEAALEEVRDWHDGTISTRFANPKTGAEVIIQQRLAERDLAGHTITQSDDWTVLCLPERYERQHPFVYPDRVELPSGRVLQGDVRETEGELLCPARIGDDESATRIEVLGAFRAAGQLQQRPATREGAILKRSGWKFFPPAWLEDGNLAALPAFTAVVQSWDTTFKDKTTSDYVVGTVWGQTGADLYLLRKVRKRMSLSLTKAEMRAITTWADDRWPRVPHRILIEKSANGVEIIEELKRELRGVTPVVASVSKVARAEAAEPALDAGNVYVPGMGEPDSPSGYNEAVTPADTQELIEEAAAFPLGEHDDQVDSFTQAVNWTRAHRSQPARTSVARSRIPSTAPRREILIGGSRF